MTCPGTVQEGAQKGVSAASKIRGCGRSVDNPATSEMTRADEYRRHNFRLSYGWRTVRIRRGAAV